MLISVEELVQGGELDWAVSMTWFLGGGLVEVVGVVVLVASPGRWLFVGDRPVVVAVICGGVGGRRRGRPKKGGLFVREEWGETVHGVVDEKRKFKLAT